MACLTLSLAVAPSPGSATDTTSPPVTVSAASVPGPTVPDTATTFATDYRPAAGTTQASRTSVVGRDTAPVKTDRDFIDLPASCIDDSGYPLLGLCRVLPRKRGAPTLVLWGDSHAWQIVPAVRAAIKDQRVNFVMFMLGGCPPMYPVIRSRTSASPSNGCDYYGNEVMDWLRAKKKRGEAFRLLVATSWELYHDVTDPPNSIDTRYPGLTNDWINENAHRALSAMPRAFQTLGRLGIPTDIVGQMPMVYLGNPRCSRGEFECDLPREGIIKDPNENNARAQEMRHYLTARGRLIRPARTLCNETVCHGRLGGAPVYLDRLHIGQRVSVQLAPYFQPTVQATLRLR